MSINSRPSGSLSCSRGSLGDPIEVTVLFHYKVSSTTTNITSRPSLLDPPSTNFNPNICTEAPPGRSFALRAVSAAKVTCRGCCHRKAASNSSSSSRATIQCRGDSNTNSGAPLLFYINSSEHVPRTESADNAVALPISSSAAYSRRRRSFIHYWASRRREILRAVVVILLIYGTPRNHPSSHNHTMRYDCDRAKMRHVGRRRRSLGATDRRHNISTCIFKEPQRIS